MGEPPRTAAPGRDVLLYDGRCALCRSQVRRLLRMTRSDAPEARSIHEDEALKPFPGITREACMEALHLVTSDGRVYRGVEAIVMSLRTRPVLYRMARLGLAPGVRSLLEWLYALIARNRCRLGRMLGEEL
jgi:predicted DCC family thiol-disulfide oxidoreductase YuxK